jgi:hypothetical protein
MGFSPLLPPIARLLSLGHAGMPIRSLSDEVSHYADDRHCDDNCHENSGEADHWSALLLQVCPAGGVSELPAIDPLDVFPKLALAV